MSKKSLMTLYAAGIFCLTLIILLHPSECLLFALNGLELWFNKMIPALFPFMILSGIMIRMNLTDIFVSVLSPLLKPLFRLSNSCIYVIFTGFLCGFPMGAHVCAQLYLKGQLTKEEATLLLSFCNNIGPIYFISFALPVIGIPLHAFPLIGMYGIPLMYGLILRYSIYFKKIPWVEPPVINTVKSTSFLAALDESVTAAIPAITRLGGYMIFFNLLNIIPVLYLPLNMRNFCNCIMEITGGLQLLQNRAPVFALCSLSFGGISCLAQTYSMLKETDLSLCNYLLHKLLLTAFCGIFYWTLTIITF